MKAQMNSLCVLQCPNPKSTRLKRVVCAYHQIEEVINDFVQHTSNAQSASASQGNKDVRKDLIARRAVHQAELKRLDEEARAIEDLRRQRIQNIQDITQQIDTLDERVASGPVVIQNYFDKFEWSGRLRDQMRKVFGIENFRLAQEGYAIFTTRTAHSEYNAACATQIWTEETSFASCPLVSDIVPFHFRAVSIDGSLLTQGPGNHSHTSYLRR